MAITLDNIPGFSDVSDAVLAADRYALGIHLNRISLNAAFGLGRLEFFTGTYKHGEVVPTPVSPLDGYVYTRDELIYAWTPQNTADQSTGWASSMPPWTMWFGVWNVAQDTGKVESQIGYRGNQDHSDRQTQSNDGLVQVFTIAQRQKNALVLGAVPAFENQAVAGFYVDRALHTDLLTDMNANAKYGVVNSEVIYMGEFAHGGVIPSPVSPIDGHVYSGGEIKFMTCWRWTADDSAGVPIAPSLAKGQLQDFTASISGSTVSITIHYESNGSFAYNTGKIAVFAFCSRSPGAVFDEVADDFVELSTDVFMPGETLRASKMLQLNRNINQAVCTPEFFASDHANGDTIALPTSPLDGYVYSRDELAYVWNWKNTGPSTSTGDRLSLIRAGISSLGVVTVDCYHLANGASNVSLAHEGTLSVIVIAKRNLTASHTPIVIVVPPATGGGDGGKTQAVNAVPLDSPSDDHIDSYADTVITWPTTFGDTDYAVTTRFYLFTNPGHIEVVAVSATDITVRLTNDQEGFTADGLVDVVGVHT